MFKIEHQPEHRRFLVNSVAEHAIESSPAVLEYVMLDNSSIDFTRTYVPIRQRGKGIAEALVEEGLNWAKQQNFTIQASCWYVDKFLTK